MLILCGEEPPAAPPYTFSQSSMLPCCPAPARTGEKPVLGVAPPTSERYSSAEVSALQRQRPQPWRCQSLCCFQANVKRRQHYTHSQEATLEAVVNRREPASKNSSTSLSLQHQQSHSSLIREVSIAAASIAVQPAVPHLPQYHADPLRVAVMAGARHSCCRRRYSCER